jgi:hypothetical protein
MVTSLAVQLHSSGVGAGPVIAFAQGHGHATPDVLNVYTLDQLMCGSNCQWGPGGAAEEGEEEEEQAAEGRATPRASGCGDDGMPSALSG